MTMNTKVLLLQLQIKIQLRRCGFDADGVNEVWSNTLATILVNTNFDFTAVTNIWRASLEAIPDQSGDLLELAKTDSSNEVWKALQNVRKG